MTSQSLFFRTLSCTLGYLLRHCSFVYCKVLNNIVSVNVRSYSGRYASILSKSFALALRFAISCFIRIFEHRALPSVFLCFIIRGSKPVMSGQVLPNLAVHLIHFRFRCYHPQHLCFRFRTTSILLFPNIFRSDLVELTLPSAFPCCLTWPSFHSFAFLRVIL